MSLRVQRVGSSATGFEVVAIALLLLLLVAGIIR